jgi:hypothetical protein
MENTKLLNVLKVVIFNIAEAVIVFLLGNIFNVEINIRIMFMVTFFLARMIIGNPKHYNKAYKCAIWSMLVFLSLYSLSSLDLIVIILLTVFTGYISTDKANINDMFMWKGKNTKNKDIEDYIKYHSLDDNLLEFERKLKQQDNVLFLIYKYRYKESKSFAEISKLLEDMPTCDISNKLDSIALTIRIYCGI